MSKVSIQGDASGTGTLTIAAPNTNSNYTLTLPTNTGTVMTSASNTFAGGLTLGGDLTLDSNGIYLGGTVAANYLDDYEEGTFTPYFANEASSTYSSRTGAYTKIGNVVYFWLDIILSNQSGTSGGAQITGLPFTSKNTILQGVGSIGGDNNWSTPRSNLAGAVSPNSTTIIIWYNAGNNLAAVQMSDIGNTGRFIIGGSYYVD